LFVSIQVGYHNDLLLQEIMKMLQRRLRKGEI